MGVRLNHNGINDVTRPFELQKGLEVNRATGKGLVHLTQEDMDKHQYFLHNKMQEAELKCKPMLNLVETLEPQTEGVSNVSKENNSQQSIRGSECVPQSAIPADTSASNGNSNLHT